MVSEAVLSLREGHCVVEPLTQAADGARSDAMTIRCRTVDLDLAPGEGAGGKTQVAALARIIDTQLPAKSSGDYHRIFSGNFQVGGC